MYQPRRGRRMSNLAPTFALCEHVRYSDNSQRGKLGVSKRVLFALKWSGDLLGKRYGRPSGHSKTQDNYMSSPN